MSHFSTAFIPLFAKGMPTEQYGSNICKHSMNLDVSARHQRNFNVSSARVSTQFNSRYSLTENRQLGVHMTPCRSRVEDESGSDSKRNEVTYTWTESNQGSRAQWRSTNNPEYLDENV